MSNVVSIEGIVVKLDEIKKLEIDFYEILQKWSYKIIIDAEFERLDVWIKNLLQNQKIDKKELRRILLTVQAKRVDAGEQVNYLNTINVGVILVRGENHYFRDTPLNKNAIKVMAKLYSKFDIRYLGISLDLKTKIEKMCGKLIAPEQLFGLYTSQKVEDSALYIYYVAGELTDMARNWVIKIKNGEINPDRHIISEIDNLQTLSNNNTNFLYPGGCRNRDEYFAKLKQLVEFNE